MLRPLLAWCVMLVVSVLNGIVRDFSYGRHLPSLLAQQLSTLSGMLLLGWVMWAYARRYRFTSARQAWRIGLSWMALTIAFEFLFFHYVSGHPWHELLANYDLTAGRLWPLLLLWLAVAPYWLYRRQTAPHI